MHRAYRLIGHSSKKPTTCLRPVTLLAVLMIFSVPTLGAQADKITAIKGGDLYTITSGIIPNGTILIKDGRIWKIGTGVPVPKDAKVIDAKGMIVMPGLVAIQGSLEVKGGRVEDALDPFSRSVSLALASGVTSVYTRGAVIKPTYADLDGMLVTKPDVISLNNFNYGWRNRTDLLMDLGEARAYLQNLAQYERDKAAGRKVTEPKRPSSASRYLPLLKRETPAMINASRASDILAALELVDEFNIRMIFSGAIEAWTVAQEIAKRNVAVILTPRHKQPETDRSSQPSGSNLENAAILKRAGVKVAIIPPSASFTSTAGGIAGRDLMTLPLEAAFAVQGGLDEQTALEAITITPAELLGVSDRLGSLQPGKDADIIILDGHPLHYNTFVQTTLINGKVLYEKKTSNYFSHIEH